MKKEKAVKEKKIREKKEKKKKKQKPVYEPVQGLLGAAEDYHIYHMIFSDRIMAALIGFAIGAVVAGVFFRNGVVAAAAGAVLIIPAQKFYRNYMLQKRQRNLLMQFKDLLESLATSYSAGQNTQMAFQDAKTDMISIHGEKSDIVEEVDIIINGMANNLTPEVLLSNFAQRSGLDDVASFANVFEVVNRQGSNLKQVISDSREIINDKIEIEMEIATMLQGNKNELNIMMVMPLVIELSLRGLGTSENGVDFFINMGLKIACLAVFAAAYMMGRKIVDIKL